ncbi:MAG TPA: hypothetical protein VEY31_05120, partial [Roseococcus sp.]|nr:hypothetical protein [Roseococcus sp.]
MTRRHVPPPMEAAPRPIAWGLAALLLAFPVHAQTQPAARQAVEAERAAALRAAEAAQRARAQA